MKKFIKKIINSILHFFGLKIIRNLKTTVILNKAEILTFQKDNPNYQLYIEGIKKSKNEISDNFFKQSRFIDLINLTKLILKNKYIYDFVEIGCWLGHSSYIISSLIQKLSQKKIDFHIFDSFEGLSRETVADENLSKKSEIEILNIRNQFKSNYEFVKNEVLQDFKFVNIYKGWIPEKFDLIAEKKFSLIHIDVDLYEPTLNSLKFFYPRLVDGGLMVCDDYNSKTFSGAKKACDEFFKNKKYSFSFSPAFGSFFIIK